jgi:hypothetical protein
VRRAAAGIATAVILLASTRALAAEQPSVDGEEVEEEDFFDTHGNLRTRAETVSFDARQQVLELSGNVRVDSPPFHLRAPRIKLTRTKLGIEVEGKGRLAFCPCLGTPLTVEFEKAFVAPPGDLIIKSPTLEFYGVPIMYLPWFWLRSDEKAGVLPPDIAYRGKDGFFVGEGVHLPWKRQGKRYALDFRAGGYLFDGFATEAHLRTPVSNTKVRYDRLRGDDGLSVDARGATDNGELRTAWDADVLRGGRGVRMTTDLDAAAKPWDRASAEGALRSGPLTVGQSMRVITRRGERLEHIESAGPVTTIRASDALLGRITYDATVEGGALRVSRPNGPITPDTVSFVRSEIGATGATNLGPISGSIALRSASELAQDGTRDGSVAMGTARAHVGVPLVRGYRSEGDENDPWLHVVEPFAEAAAITARGASLLGTAPGRLPGAIDTDAAITSGGLTTSLGRWGNRGAIEATVAAGGGFVPSVSAGLFRGRLSSSFAWFGATVDAASLGESIFGGQVVVARARVGPTNGLRLLGNVAERGFQDPTFARFLVNEAYEPSAQFLARRGTTGGTTLVIPWHRAVTTSMGADYDATNQELVGARGGIELHDRCGCVTLRANGSHRIGRPGVDVWVALDFNAM